MEKPRDLTEFSSVITEVIALLQRIIKDAENTEMSADLARMRVREHADDALKFMQSLQQSLGDDKSG